MNHRIFLSALASAFALDPERLLWTRGKKLISIPKRTLPLWPTRIDFVYGLQLTPEAIEQAYRDVNAMLDRWKCEPLRRFPPVEHRVFVES